MEQPVGRSLVVWYPSVLVASLVGGFVGNLSTSLLFALISETLFYFLTLCFTALIAALCAVLAGNALADDGRRGRLWLVVGVSEAAAILASLANLAFVYTVSDDSALYQVGLGQQMTFSTIVIALVSGVATWSLRRPPAASNAEETHDGKSTVILIMVSMFLIVLGLWIDGLTGPVA